MLFNSFPYLLFLPIIVLLYYLCPKQIRYIWLLVSSYYFYLCFDRRLWLYLTATILLTYAVGILMEKLPERTGKSRARFILSLYAASQIGLLGYFKYADFFLGTLENLFPSLGIQLGSAVSGHLVPVGVSFIIFQSLSYIIDIYRGDIRAERNVLKVGLLIAFFPKLASGPIERADRFFRQIDVPASYQLRNIKEGLFLILSGLFQKIAIADNIANIIRPVLTEYKEYSGIQLCLAVILFAFQIYCDFGGYTCLALGSARMFGFRLTENFRAPYLAESVSDFWRRWHISLTSWFRDYLYIPLGGNRKGAARKRLNTLIVFALSGLWHGAAWTFVIWGTLNGIYIVVESFAKKPILHVPFSTRFRRRLVTFLLVDFAWLFFYMPDLASAMKLLVHAVTQPGIRELFSLGFLDMFPSMAVFAILIVSLLILFWMDRIQEQKGRFADFLFNQSSCFRWLFCICLLLITIIFGAYGDTYEQTQFIYFQF